MGATASWMTKVNSVSGLTLERLYQVVSGPPSSQTDISKGTVLVPKCSRCYSQRSILNPLGIGTLAVGSRCGLEPFAIDGVHRVCGGVWCSSSLSAKVATPPNYTVTSLSIPVEKGKWEVDLHWNWIREPVLQESLEYSSELLWGRKNDRTQDRGPCCLESKRVGSVTGRPTPLELYTKSILHSLVGAYHHMHKTALGQEKLGCARMSACSAQAPPLPSPSGLSALGSPPQGRLGEVRD